LEIFTLFWSSNLGGLYADPAPAVRLLEDGKPRDPEDRSPR